jgi:hypothetical protein
MRITVRLLLPLSGLLFAAPAFAQQDLSPQGLRGGAPKAPVTQNKAEPPPPAVPGARARPDSVAPSSRATADMPPTEALFDAINRGDIASARDAISRGADLDGTNLLGMTPLALSVDLGRNDISFLLLSLRGSDGSSSAEARNPGQGNGNAAPPSPADRKRALAEARADSRARERTNRVAVAPPPAHPARQTPALFAGNGGTAVPAAGFLGFDPHQ